MKNNLTEEVPDRGAMELTRLYRLLRAELDGLEATKENGGSSAEDLAGHLTRSREICGHLRKLAHALIAAEDEGRSQLGKSLQDDILQVMVGIHIRLLTLDQAVSAQGDEVKKEIAMIQQMVQESSDLLSAMSERQA